VCTGWISKEAYYCSSTGVCTAQFVNCQPYACVSGNCLTSCRTATDCGPWWTCQGGVCR
jgi:hypothetical protein